MDKKVFQKKLGNQIVKIRTKKGISQSDLARACDKDRQSIERLESGNINASAYYLYEVAQGLKVSIKDIFDFK